MLAYDIYTGNIKKRDQDILDRVSCQLHQLKKYKRHTKRNGNRSHYLFKHEHRKIAVAAMNHKASYKDKQSDSGAVIKKRFILDDGAYIF